MNKKILHKGIKSEIHCYLKDILVKMYKVSSV